MEEIVAKSNLPSMYAIECELCHHTGDVLHFPHGHYHGACFEQMTAYLAIVNYKADHILFDHVDYPFLTTVTTIQQLYAYDLARGKITQ